MPSAGRITVALSGDLLLIPDGAVLSCTFTIQAGASGSTILTFQSAGLADDEFNDYDASGSNGSITVEDASGSVVAETVNGAIKVNFLKVAPERAMAFSTLNGNVDVVFPANIKAAVRMRSDNGEIYTDFDLVLDPQGPKMTEERSAKGYRLVVEKELQGRINGGGPEFYFKTFNGNIYIRKAK